MFKIKNAQNDWEKNYFVLKLKRKGGIYEIL